jgi:hypothetical protein
MLARPTLKRPQDQEDATAAAKGQARPMQERFLLRVDGQVKRSFGSKEPAACPDADLFRGLALALLPQDP